MKILILTEWYPPEPAFLLQELAQVFQNKGHNVTVLTGFPNYPSGKIYPGYRIHLRQYEKLNGVSVIRVPLFPDHSLSSLRRIINYISFAIASSFLGFWVAPKPDVIFVYHPPLTIGLPSFVLSRLWRVPFVYMVQDMWPESLRATEMLYNRCLLQWVGRFAQWVYNKAHSIIVITPGFRRNLLKKGVPDGKIHVISNWINTNIYRPIEPDDEFANKLGLSGRFNVMYAGNMGEAQGLETVLAAANILSDVPAVQFVFVGDGISLPRLKKIAKDKHLLNVRFIGRCPFDVMPSLYALAEVLLVHLKDDPLFRITIPSKTLAYMASGKPIIAAVTGDVADLITRAGAGIVCPPGEPLLLAESVRQLYRKSPQERREMGERGRKFAIDEFCPDVLISDIEKQLKMASFQRI